MVLSAYHSQLLSPSGASFAVALHLLPNSGGSRSSSAKASTSFERIVPDTHRHRGQLLSHIVTARDDVLSVYEVRQRVGVEEEDGDAEQVQIYLLRAHRLFGIVTGLGKCAIGSSSSSTDAASGRDRDTLVVSFRDAKMALMQWSEADAGLITVSIHTYERAPQLADGLPNNFLPILALDPDMRCAALLLPEDSLALLPFYNDTAAELDEMLELAERQANGTLSLENTLPYAPSFVLSLREADEDVKNVRDVVFLPHFQRPTVAVLYEREATWTGRLGERLDTCSLHLVTLDLASSSSSASSASHSVISTRDSLPFDCLYIHACPATIGGGVFVVTTSAIFHVDQGGRIVGLAVNGWHEQTSRLHLPRWDTESESGTQQQTQLDLANSHLLFPDSDRSTTALLFLQDGTIFSIHCELDGRTLSSLSLERRAETVQPAVATKLPNCDFVFAASMLGRSELLSVQQTKEILAATHHSKSNGKVEKEDDDADMDLDDDLYGDSAMPSTSNGGTSGADSKNYRMDWKVEKAASLPAFGPIHSLTPMVSAEETIDGDSGVPQTAACVGGGKEGGIAILEPKVVPRKRRRLPLNGSCGLWHLSSNLADKQRKILVSYDKRSEICSVNDEDCTVTSSVHLDGRTLAACSIDAHEQGLRLLRVTAQGLLLQSDDGQIICDSASTRAGKGKGKHKKSEDTLEVYQAAVQAPFAALLHSDGTMKVYKCDGDSLEKLELGQDLEKATFLSASIFEDKYDTFYKSAGQDTAGVSPHPAANAEAAKSRAMDEDEEIDYGDDDIDEAPAKALTNGHGDSEEKRRSLWLAVISSRGSVQLHDLTSVASCVWRSNSLYSSPSRLEQVEGSIEEGSSTMEVGQVLLTHIGDSMHIAVVYDNGLLSVYEANTASGGHESRNLFDRLTFIKCFARHMDPAGLSVLRPPNGEAVSGIRPSLRSFLHQQRHASVFVGGMTPGWLVRMPQGDLQFFECAVPAIDACDVADAHSDEVDLSTTFVYSQYGMVGLAQLPDLDYTLPIAHRRLQTGRTYTNAAPHPFTKTLVAASVVEQDFVLFDPESGAAVEDPTMDPSPAKAPRSTLELFASGSDEPIDGYEFEQCEVVCSVELVTLRSVTTVSGLRDFIAVGTMMSHGEDRPAKGATYIFDIIEVVTSADDPAARYKLKLLAKDEGKGPITAVTDINGYLVVVMGLKLFVRSLENDEWLVTVAFLDTPFHCTSLRRLKNFFLLTDVQRNVWLVAFQEEPFRLVVVAKDQDELYATTGNFLLSGPAAPSSETEEARSSSFAIVTTAMSGVLRLLDYAPSVPSTHGGQKLLLCTEYGLASEATCSVVVPGEAADGGLSTSSEVVLGMKNGAIDMVVPIDEAVSKRLTVLQGQMVRNVQHTAGLNPRAFR